MRRRSIVAPLLLIAIGVAFLIRNLNPEWPLMDMLVTWWPFVLIGWGAIRLVEVAFLYFTDRQLPFAGVSGGEWALVVVLTLIGSTVWGVQRFTREGFGKFRIGGVEVFGESYDYPSDPTKIQTGKAPRLFVENPRGVTRVTGADITEVRISSRKTIRAMDRATADRANERTMLKVDQSGDSLSVLTNQERAENARVSNDLEITVPFGAAVEIRGKGADVDISGVNGEVAIHAEGGGVRALNLAGNLKLDARGTDILRAEKVKGAVTIEGRGRDIELSDIGGPVEISGAFSGETLLRRIERSAHFVSSRTELRLEKVPGEMSMGLTNLSLTNVTGPFTLRAKSKDVVMTEVTGPVNIDIDRGGVEWRQSAPPAGRVEVQTGSGDIRLLLPANARFSLNAETVRGDVVNQFHDKLVVETRNRGGQITGSVGQGGPEIRLQTARGNLMISKAGPVPMAPAAPKPPKSPSPPERASDQ
jgi:DUF4097 and DUF4098 domain-containing protein YvlB